MNDLNDSLTLDGLARILRDHIDWTAARFGEVGTRLDAVVAGLGSLGSRVDDLTGQMQALAGIVRDQALRAEDRDSEIREMRQYIRQIFSRMEHYDARLAEHDARFEAMSQEIRELREDTRRILDTLQRPGGDGDTREP